MQEYLNENTLFATVAMTLSEISGLALVVEGAHDHLTLDEHCSSDLHLIAGVGGKMNILRAAALASERSLGRARFLVDRDFDSFENESILYGENVHVSDSHDLFTDAILNDTNLVPKIVKVHTNALDGRLTCTAKNPAMVETLIRKAKSLASDLASVHVVDKRRGLSLDFKRFSFWGLDEDEFNEIAIGKIVLERSKYSEGDVDEILQDFQATRSEIEMLPRPCFGDHDFLNALSRVLKLHNVSIKSVNLHKGLILAITCRSFNSTSWFREIQEWCALKGKQGFNCDIGEAIAA